MTMAVRASRGSGPLGAAEREIRNSSPPRSDTHRPAIAVQKPAATQHDSSANSASSVPCNQPSTVVGSRSLMIAVAYSAGASDSTSSTKRRRAAATSSALKPRTSRAAAPAGRNACQGRAAIGVRATGGAVPDAAAISSPE